VLHEGRHRVPGKALVLGGGGVVGVAWLTGLIKGLIVGGVDPAQADLIVGTSAGSIVGTQIAAGHSFHAIYDAQVAPPDPGIGNAASAADTEALTAIFSKWTRAHEMTQALCAEVGAMALGAKTADESVFVDAIGSAMGVTDWPEQRLVATAVDALTGEFVTWSRESGAPLARAIASSCAVPGIFAPITVNGRRYVDGGVHSGTCADVALGHDFVIVVAPIGVRPEGIGGVSRRALDKEVEQLRQSGATVEVVFPDEAALEAFGPNLMDPSRRAAAAKAGLVQGTGLAGALRAAWAGATV
jgi:NTE family protein